MSSQKNESKSYDPLGLVDVGSKFRDEVVFDGLPLVFHHYSSLACSKRAPLIFDWSNSHLLLASWLYAAV